MPVADLFSGLNSPVIVMDGGSFVSLRHMVRLVLTQMVEFLHPGIYVRENLQDADCSYAFVVSGGA